MKYKSTIAPLGEQAFYTALFESTQDAIIVTDTSGDGLIISVNPAACHLFGYDEEEFLQLKQPREAMIDISDPRFNTFMDQRDKKGHAKGELKYKRKDGSLFLGEISSTYFVDGSGNRRAVTIIRDITERKQVEEELRRKQQLLSAIMENIPLGITIADAPNVNILEVSRYGRELTGRPVDQIEGISVDLHTQQWGIFRADGVTPATNEELPLTRATQKGELVRGEEFVLSRPDGTKVPILCTAAPIRDANGNITGGVIGWQDITERKRAEEALRQSEGKYRKIFEGAAEGIYQTTMEGKYLSVNPAFARMFGFSSPQEMIDSVTNIGHQLYVDPQTRDRMIRMLIENGKAEGFEAEVYRKDRSKFWISINIHIVRDANGQILYFEGTNLDITERKQAEEALQKAKDELEIKVLERTAQLTEINNAMIAEIEERKRTEKRLRSAQKNLRAMAAEIVMADERSRQHFAADLHDTVIQTIGAAKMRSHLIQDEIPKKVLKDFRELQDFISQSISQARFIMAEMSPPVLNELGFIPAIEWLTEQIGTQHGIHIEFQAAYGFKPLQHEIQVLLFQATRELLMNVVKHAHAKKVLIKMSAKKQKIRIEVIDDGRGFDKRQAFRTDVSSGGFGLFSIRERIRHFGGHLFIQSEAGNGTRVVLTAPHTPGGGR